MKASSSNVAVLWPLTTASCLTLIFTLTLISTFPLTSSLPKVDPSIQKTLETAPTIDLILSFKGNNKEILSRLESRQSSNPTPNYSDSLDPLYKQLRTEATKTFSKVIQQVNDENAKKQSSNLTTVFELWSINGLILLNVDSSLVKTLSTFEEISEITPNEIHTMTKTKGSKPKAKPRQVDAVGNLMAWGVTSIQARRVWREVHIVNGSGAVVGIISTGVEGGHPTLKDNYRSSFGWFDAVGYLAKKPSSTPKDFEEEGTLFLSIAVGRKVEPIRTDIGVAPGAQWVACRGVNDDLTVSINAILMCMEWMFCPTTLDRKTSDCSKSPNVVLNPWSIDKEDVRIEDMIAAWESKRMTPIFSIGDTGPACGTARYPGRIPKVIGVGTMEETSTVYTTSSRGPVAKDVFKPDVVAPGVGILAAYPVGIGTSHYYLEVTGSGAAAAHVAGLAALMYSASPRRANPADFKKFLHNSALPTEPLGPPCGNVLDDNIHPNHKVGYGKIHAIHFIKAVDKLYDFRSEGSPSHPNLCMGYNIILILTVAVVTITMMTVIP